MGASLPPAPNERKIHPNKVARRIVQMSKVIPDKQFTRIVVRQYRSLRKRAQKSSEFSRPFTNQEVDLALLHMKTGKAAGFDCIYPEFLVHSGPNVRAWLARFMTNVIQTNTLPAYFKKTKVIAILKPGKPAELPDSYRPIALQSVTLKLLERLLYNRINPVIDKVVPTEQAGFRTDRSCTDKVLVLTNYIEAGYQRTAP